MMTVNEVSKLSGISVRTLHYYDQIGLLHPDQVSEAGYRLYGQASLERLQQILLFRQLEFPLKEIKDIIDSPDFNKEEALDQQIQMLRLQQEHLSGLINLALEIKKNGVNKMDFKPFDTSKLDEYAKEAKERGCTRAAICMERGAVLAEEKNIIFAIGNAPTALIRLYELIKEGKLKPALIIGAPVGFVNVVESKELIMEAGVPFIVPKGRKGGSNIAATICNAMLYQL